MSDFIQDLSGSFHFGRMANIDEAYATFQAFGLLSDDARKTAAASLVVNQHAGALNRLLQFGEASKTTRSRGNFGEGATPKISSCIMSNMHPEIAVPMDRAEIGNHVGCTKERIFFYTAEPVSPHSSLPADYILPPGHTAWVWAEMDPDMAQLCGLRALVADPEGGALAEQEGNLCRASDDTGGVFETSEEDALEEARGVVFMPDAAGYDMKFPDGVSSRWRYRIEPGDSKVAIMECRVGNRDIPLPQQHDVRAGAKSVLEFFGPHTRLVFDASAQRLFAAVRTQCSVQATLATDSRHCSRRLFSSFFSRRSFS